MTMATVSRWKPPIHTSWRSPEIVKLGATRDLPRHELPHPIPGSRESRGWRNPRLGRSRPTSHHLSNLLVRVSWRTRHLQPNGGSSISSPPDYSLHRKRKCGGRPPLSPDRKIPQTASRLHDRRNRSSARSSPRYCEPQRFYPLPYPRTQTRLATRLPSPP